MSLRCLPFVRKLKEEDVVVLKAIERMMDTYNHVPIEELPASTEYNTTRVDRILTKLHTFKLVKRWSQNYAAIYLTYDGLDALALYSLRNLQTIGPPVGVGKESRVFNAEFSTPEGTIEVLAKIHRLERAFKATRRMRNYSKDRHHLKPLEESQIAARKEYDALMRLYPRVRVPRPYAYNRHIIVMEKIEGDELSKVRNLDKTTAKGLLDDILAAILETFRCGLIHSDLSEFNVIVTKDHEPILIDWPQWVNETHENREMLLERDIANICVFFSRKYDIDVPTPQDIVKDILKTF